MKKKICMILVAAALALCLCACGNSDNDLEGRWKSDQYKDIYKFEDGNLLLEKYEYQMYYTVTAETDNEDGSKTYTLEVHDEDYPDEIQTMDAVVKGKEMTFGEETFTLEEKIK